MFLLSAAEQIEIEILTAPVGYSVVLLGIVFFNNSPLIAHNAMNGSMTSTRLRALSMNRVFMDMLIAVGVDTSIFSFFHLEDDASLYAYNLLYCGWRAVTRQSDPLYLLPPDSSILEGYSMMRTMLRQVLYDNRTLPATAIDLYMDRYHSAANRNLWMDNQLTPAGGQSIANILLKALGLLQSVTSSKVPTDEDLQAMLDSITLKLTKIDTEITESERTIQIWT
jgi:hypothetical protein